MNKKTFKIPVEWAVFGTVNIEAETLEDAIRIFDETVESVPLPEGDYIDGSFIRCKQSNSGYTKDDIEYYELFNT